jgi:hypothetical protein
MQLPGEFFQGIPTNFTAINRNYVIQAIRELESLGAKEPDY